MIANMTTSISHARREEGNSMPHHVSIGNGNRAPRAFGCVALATLILLSLPASIYAQEALPYGRDFQRLVGKPNVAIDAQVILQTDLEPISAQVDLYLEQILELERQAGPYGGGLDEPLFALARVQRETGDINGALASYRRAMHLIRINEGLYSERQLPLVREVLDLYRDLGDYAALDQRYEYFFRLYGGGQPPFDEVRLRAVLEYFRWQREALALKLESPLPERRLLDLYDLNKSVIRAAIADPGVSGQWRIALLESQFSNMYLLQEHIKPRITESMAGVGTASTRQLYGVAGMEDADPLENRLMALKRTLVGKGRSLAEDLLEQAPQMEALQRGRVELLLADWYQWNLMRTRAAEHYTKAYALIESSGEREILEASFYEPVELPDNGAFVPLAALEQVDPAASLATASFQVSEKGRAVDIVVSVGDEALRGKGIRLRRQLSQVAFRPSYTKTGAQPVEVVDREYRIFAR